MYIAILTFAIECSDGLEIASFKQTFFYPSTRMASHLIAGEPIIVCLEPDNLSEIQALYRLDNNNRPFQVVGSEDVLIGRHIFEDRTYLFIMALNQAKQMIATAMEALDIQEIIKYQFLLRQWEQSIIQSILRSSHEPSIILLKTIILAPVYYFCEPIKTKIMNVVNDTSVTMTKNTLQSSLISINMEEYTRSDYGLWKYISNTVHHTL